MSETQTPETNHFQNLEQAEAYVQAAREHYRDGHASYQGNHRNEDQQLIAEVTSDEARHVMTGVISGIAALNGTFGHEGEIDERIFDEVQIGNHSWREFSNSYEHMMAGFGILTERLHNRGFDVPSFAYLDQPDKMKVYSVLLSDFLRHNGLRFGAEPTGLQKSDRKRVHNEDGGIDEIVTYSDRDQAKNDFELEANMKRRGYNSRTVGGRPNIHQAGKLSPKEYIELRRSFGELEKDDFDRIVAGARDARATLEGREED